MADDPAKLVTEANKLIKEASDASNMITTFEKGALDGVKSVEEDYDKVSKGKLPKKGLVPGLKVVAKDLGDSRGHLDDAKKVFKEFPSLITSLDKASKEMTDTLKDVNAALDKLQTTEKQMQKDIDKANFLLIKAEKRLEIIETMMDKLPG